MKGIRNSLVLVAASVVMVGTAHAQDAFSWFNRGAQTNSVAGVNWEMKTEPKVELFSDIWLTGLFVDFSQPTQSWAMLKSPVPAGDPQRTLPPSQLPLTVPDFPYDPSVVHSANFVLLRLSFP